MAYLAVTPESEEFKGYDWRAGLLGGVRLPTTVCAAYSPLYHQSRNGSMAKALLVK
jgi:hypothetical protein